MKILAKSALGLMVCAGIAIGGGDIAPVEPVVPVPPVVQDDTDYFYGGVALSYNNVYADKLEWFDIAKSQDKLLDIMGIIGYNYNEYLAVEGRLYTTISQKDYSESFGWSIFLKPKYEFRDEEDIRNREDFFTAYVLLGFGNEQLEGTDGRSPGAPSIVGKTIADETTFQWGVGLSYTFVDEDSDDRSGDWSVFIEYLNLLNDADLSPKPTVLYANDPTQYNSINSDALVIGLTYRF